MCVLLHSISCAKCEARGVSVDSTNRIVIVGFSFGTIPGPEDNLKVRGKQDAVIIMFDINNHFNRRVGGSPLVWIRSLGALSEYTAAMQVAVDKGSDNIFVTGYTTGQLGANKIGSTDMFIAKYDSSGNRKYILQMGATKSISKGMAISWRHGKGFVAVQSDGNFDGLVKTGNKDLYYVQIREDSEKLRKVRVVNVPITKGSAIGYAVAQDSFRVVIAGQVGCNSSRCSPLQRNNLTDLANDNLANGNPHDLANDNLANGNPHDLPKCNLANGNPHDLAKDNLANGNPHDIANDNLANGNPHDLAKYNLANGNPHDLAKYNLANGNPHDLAKYNLANGNPHDLAKYNLANGNPHGLSWSIGCPNNSFYTASDSDTKQCLHHHFCPHKHAFITSSTIGSASRATVKFSRITSAPASPGCKRLLQKDTLKGLGSNPSCVWRARGRFLDIFFGKGWTTTRIGIVSGIIGSYHSPNITSTAQYLEISVPKGAGKVTTRLKGPRIIGQCLKFQLTLDATGHAGKPMTISWSYVRGSSSNNPKVQRLVSREKGSILVLSGADFAAGTHTFSAKATNWLNKSSTSRHKFVQAEQLPTVLAKGGTEFNIKPSDEIRISLQIFTSVCLNGSLVVTAGRGYWSQVFQNSPYLYSESAKEVASDISNDRISISRPRSQTIYLAPGTLQSGSIYAFNCFGFIDNAPVGQGVNTTFLIAVSEPDVVALISGGSSRTISVIAGSPSNVFFDAQTSSDPSNPNTGPIGYEWFLFRVSSDDFGNEVITDVPLPSAANGKQNITFSTALLESNPNALYSIQLSVQGLNSRLNGNTRFAYYRQLLQATETSVPDVSISISSKSNPNIVQVQDNSGVTTTAYKVEQSRKVRIITSVAGSSSTKGLTYSYYSDEINFNDKTNLASRDAKGPQVVIARNKIRGKLVYTIKVSVTNTHGATGSASLTLIGNSPPSGGTCGVSPLTGVSLVDSFTLSCEDWEDTDTPIEYRFLADTTGNKRRSGLDRLCSWSESPTCTRDLQAPQRGNVTILPEIRDSLGSVASSSIISLRVSLASSGVDVTKAASQIAQQVEAGQTSNIGALAGALVSYVRSNLTKSNTTSSGNSGAPAADESFIRTSRSLRSNLLLSAKTLTEKNDGSGESSLAAPLAIAKAATEFTDPRELDTSILESALSLVERASSKLSGESETVSDEVIESSVASVGNVLTSASLSSNVSSATLTVLSRRSESVLINLGNSLVTNTIAGEDASEVVSSRLTLYSKKESPTSVVGQSYSYKSTGLTAASGSNTTEQTKVNIPSSLKFNSSEDVVVSVAYTSANAYPSPVNVTSGSLIIQLLQSGKAQEISNLSDSIEFSVPLGNVAVSNSTSALCRYWDPVANNWSTAGVTSGNVTSESSVIVCKTSHLTTFGVVQQTLKDEIHIEVNTISKDDITEEAFSYNNPIMVFCSILFLVWICLLVLAFRHDMKLSATKGEKISSAFWREFNRMRRLRLAKRSWWNCFIMSRWGFQRRHTWLSIFFRHHGDFMTMAKRVTILFVLLFTMMTTCALLLDTNQKIGPLPPFASSGIVSAVLSIPIPVFLGYVHRRRVPPTFSVPLARRGVAFTCLGYLLIFILVCLSSEPDSIEGFNDGDGEAKEDDGMEGEEEGEDEDVKSDRDNKDLAEENDEDIKAGNPEEGQQNADDFNAGETEDAQENQKDVKAGDIFKAGETEHENMNDVRSKNLAVSLGIGAGALAGTQAALTPTANKKKHGQMERKTPSRQGDKDFRNDESNNQSAHKLLMSPSHSSMDSHYTSRHMQTVREKKVSAIKFVNDKGTPSVGRSLAAMDESAKSFGGNGKFLDNRGKFLDNSVEPEIRASSEGALVYPDDNKEKNHFKRRKRVAGMHVNEKVKELMEKRSRKYHKPVRCYCCDLYSKRSLRVDTHYWSYRDVFASVTSAIIILGCWFLLATLSYSLKKKYNGWITGTLIAFAQDFGMRALQVIFLEFCMFAPICCLCFGWCSISKQFEEEKGELSKGVSICFQTGSLGFDFYNLKVDAVDPCGPAHNKGVKVGWKIVRVRDTFVNNDDECFHELQDVHRTERKFFITFSRQHRKNYYESGVHTPSHSTKPAKNETQFKRNSNTSGVEAGFIEMERLKV
ncbi:hypothetical protein AAMO2058_000093200 [Amorphochlora amoebiformis]